MLLMGFTTAAAQKDGAKASVTKDSVMTSVQKDSAKSTLPDTVASVLPKADAVAAADARKM